MNSSRIALLMFVFLLSACTPAKPPRVPTKAEFLSHASELQEMIEELKAGDDEDPLIEQVETQRDYYLEQARNFAK
jgi:hypothetical protein